MSFLGLKDPSLNFLQSSMSLCSNSSPISNSPHFEISHVFSRNINSLLQLRIMTHIIERASQNENNLITKKCSLYIF